MDLEKEILMEEGVDLKFFFLRVWKYMWIVAVAALSGAAICAGGYRIFQRIFPEAKEFKAETKYYIDFAEDSTGVGYGYYNDYTWNDWMKSDAILQYTMELLAGAEIAQEEVEQAVKADIISDVRLLTITVTCSEKGRADRIADATAKSLAHFPEDIKEIDAIRVIRSDAAKEVVAGDRMKNWGIFGFCFVGIGALLCVCLAVCMDSAVYLPKEMENRFGIPVLGVLYQGQKEEDSRAELAANAGYLLKDKKRIALVDLNGTEERKKETAKPAAELVTEVLSEAVECAAEQGLEVAVERFTDGKMPDFEMLRKADAVLVLPAYGRTSRKRIERYFSDFRKQDCKIAGAIITGADRKLYRSYYRNKK